MWARHLSLLTGSGVRASAAVVALTIAGLALGSRWAATRADRSPRPLAVYALLEGMIALWALATPWLFRLLPRLALSLAAERDPAAADLGAGSLVATALLLLPGTFLMGATTPFLVRHGSLHWLRPGSGSAGSLLGVLYGWNTLGGAAGSLATVFALLPWLGMARTIRVAGLLGAAVAACAILLFGRLPALREPGDRTESPAGASSSPRARPRARILGAILAAGCLGGVCQLGWTRLLVLLFGSSTHALAITLAACLAGLALGSAWAGRGLERGRPAERLARLALLGAAGATSASIFLWGKAPALIVLAQGRLGRSFGGALALQALLCIPLLLPTAFALGALLPALTALLRGGGSRAGRDSGDAFSVDSWGSVLGALAAAFLLLPRWGVEGTLRATGFAEILLLLLLAAGIPGPRPSPAPLLRRAILPAACLLLLILLPAWDPALMTSGPLLYAESYQARGGGVKQVEKAMRGRGRLRFLEEGPEATVTVREGALGVLSLQINGKTDASSGGDLSTQILAGRLPALLHPGPLHALVIGLASGTTAGTLATEPLERLDCVEISPAVARAALLFSAWNGGVLTDPRFHLRLGDGRAYLQGTSARYDLITSQPTNPWIAGVTNLFTQEFFSLARERLADGGVLAVWIQGYALDPEDFRSAVATFLHVFPEAQLWEESAAGGDYFLIGRRGGKGPDLDLLESRLGASGEAGRDLGRAGIFDTADLLSRFVAGPRGLSLLSRNAPLVRDDDLRLEFSAPRALWEFRMPGLISSLEEIREPPLRFFAPPPTPAGAALRARLEEMESRRRSRIRLALSLRRPDYDILSFPEISVAAGLIRKGLPDAALPLLREARSRAPASPALALLQGWILLGRGEPEEALEVFSEARSLDPASSEAAHGEGLAAWRSGDVERAESLFRIASDLAPDDPEPRNNLASALLAEGREEEALSLLDGVLTGHPRHVPARINRGVALARLGRPDEAVAEYLRALELEPGNADAAYNLKRARERSGGKGAEP